MNVIARFHMIYQMLSKYHQVDLHNQTVLQEVADVKVAMVFNATNIRLPI